jgi:CspA family cold shock protein
LKELEGTVKRWLGRGYGIIKVEGQEDDVFVHRNDIAETFQLKEGQKVKFYLEDSPKGPRAVNVEIIE